MSEPEPERTSLEVLAAAVQSFANELTDGPELIDNAVVVWESVSYGDEGEVQRCIRYAVPTNNFTMSGTLGLLEAGHHYVRRDILDHEDDV